jgi:tryptophanyl-tRNA synthetase
MLSLQDDPNSETLYMVADAHAVTTPFDPEELRLHRREVIVDYLAAGLDPNKSILFQQADVAGHFELAFYFSSAVTIARMQHLPTFKEKVKQHPESATMALLNYPVLMAADILLYQASAVPVGIDQEPHLEIAREIARKFNAQYGTSFPEPQRFATPGGYIPSLTGEGKMSKSVEGSYILLMDSLDEIRKKVRSVPTSSEVGGEMGSGVKTLFSFLELLAPQEVPRFQASFADGTLRYVDLKDTVAEAIFAELKPVQQRRRELKADPAAINQVITSGRDRANKIAQATLKEVKEKLGLLE